jgi:hypothetical protein
MTIPSTKASTANVDEGGDKISLARADIKQNIDNVNEIIDHLDEAGAFLPAHITYGDGLTTTQETSAAHVAESPTLITAGATGISIVAGDSAGGPNKISIPAGTYIFETNASVPKVSQNQDIASIALYDETNDNYFFVNDIILIESAPSTQTRMFYPRYARATFGTGVTVGLHAVATQTANYNHLWIQAGNTAFNIDSSGDSLINNNIGCLIKITKIA